MAAALFGLLAKWVRVASLVVIAYYRKMKNALIYDYVTYGWMIYAVTVVIFLWVANYIPAAGRTSLASLFETVDRGLQ